MASDAIAAGRPEGGGEKPAATTSSGDGGFFHVYKRGQGYWTRMGSAGAAALIAALTIQFLYSRLPVWVYPLFDPKLPPETAADVRGQAIAHAQSLTKITNFSICGVVLAAFAMVVFYLLNKPAYADFLIATDSEMKKVNWTSRKELIGSTKVVIIFMFLICILLFGFDLLFGDVFHHLGVLKGAPFEGAPWVLWTFRIVFVAAAALIGYLSLKGDRATTFKTK